jgi:hypothetical protein
LDFLHHIWSKPLLRKFSSCIMLVV